MMSLCTFLLLLVTSLVPTTVSAGSLPQQVYWEKRLPKTPMPTILRQLLNTDVRIPFTLDGDLYMPSSKMNYFWSNKGVLAKDDPNKEDYMLYKNLKPGWRMPLHSLQAAKHFGFLPRDKAKSIPFSSLHIQEILAMFSVRPNTTEAEAIWKTIRYCENPTDARDSRLCTTSLESMVDYAMDTLKTSSVKASSTTALEDKRDVNVKKNKQVYTIVGVEKMEGSKSLVCHPMVYPYAVHLCHVTHETKAYKVAAAGEDGTMVDAVVTCHMETSNWNPEHTVFLVLKEKPGVPICHFLASNEIIWSAAMAK